MNVWMHQYTKFFVFKIVGSSMLWYSHKSYCAAQSGFSTNTPTASCAKYMEPSRYKKIILSRASPCLACSERPRKSNTQKFKYDNFRYDYKNTIIKFLLVVRLRLILDLRIHHTNLMAIPAARVIVVDFLQYPRVIPPRRADLVQDDVAHPYVRVPETLRVRLKIPVQRAHTC